MKRVLLLFVFLIIQLSTFSQGHTCQTDYFPVKNPKNRMWGYMNLLGEWSVIAQYTKTYPFRGKIAVVQKGLKFGAINCNLKSVIPINYDEIKAFVGSSGWVRKGKYWGLIHDSGKVLLEPVYSEIKELNHYSSEVWVKTKTGLWGLYSKYDGNWIVRPTYSDVKVLNQYFSIVELESKKGFINNLTGELKVKTELDKVIKIAPYVSAIQRDDKWGVISDNAILITKIEFDSISAFSSTKLIVTKDSLQYLINSRTGHRNSKTYTNINPLRGGASVVELNQKFGYINARGREFIKLDFLSATNFESLRAVVGDSLGYYIIMNNGKSVFDDSAHFRNITPLNNSKAFVLKTDSNLVIVNYNGIVKLIDVDAFKDVSEIIRVSLYSKWYFYNVGTFQLDNHSFDEMNGYVDGFIRMKNDGDYLLYKAFVSESLSQPYEEIVSSSVKDVFVVKLEGKYAIWNNGKVVSDYYDEVKTGHNSSFIYQQKKKWGLLSAKGTIITNAQYLNIKPVPTKLFCVRNKKSLAVLKLSGKVFFENSEIDDITGFREGYFVVVRDGRYFLMNKSGKFNFKNGYENLSLLYKGKCAFQQDGKWGVINKKGVILVKAQHSSYSIENGELILN